MRIGEKARRERDAKRDIGVELLQAIRGVKAGKGKSVAVQTVAVVRRESGMSQAKFADVLGVSARTLQ